MTILVTGAAGFIGFHITKRLLREGFEVVGMDNLSPYYDLRLKKARLQELEDFSKKQSVKFDEKQPFPQFSLNVSNPISWKLMLLIMLMQLLTNMMLVVVLYLK